MHMYMNTYMIVYVLFVCKYFINCMICLYAYMIDYIKKLL